MSRRDRKPKPKIAQPIVRGPAVQGAGQPAQERYESSDAGRKGARTVKGRGTEPPAPPPEVPGASPDDEEEP